MTLPAPRPTMQRRFNPELVYAPGSPLEEIERQCRTIAQSDSTVLITGDTGTGKEVFARLIHLGSTCAAGPFVPVNCGAIPEALLESELFGVEKGAFTGAHASRKGRIAHADGGTLFLDEIGELPLSMQVKLLRVLQERSYEAVGSQTSIRASFRLVAATNRDLAAEVEAGRFRRDLYYRLLVCPVLLPSLRERPADVEPLVMHYWRERGESREIAPEAMRALSAHSWPGNVRELQNLVERISVCTTAPRIELSHLPAPVRGEPASVIPLSQPMASRAAGLRLVQPDDNSELPLPEIRLPVDLPGLLRGLEEAYVEAALARAQGSRKAAAELLGLQRTTLVEKLRRWGRDPGKSPRELPDLS